MNNISAIGSSPASQVQLAQFTPQSTSESEFAPFLSEAQSRIDSQLQQVHQNPESGVPVSNLDNPVKYGLTNADMIQYLNAKYVGNPIQFTAFGLSKEPLIPEGVIHSNGQFYFKVKDSDKLVKINLVGYQGKDIVPYKEPVVLDPRQTARYQAEQILTNTILSAGTSDTSLGSSLTQSQPDPNLARMIQERNPSNGDFMEYTNLSNKQVNRSKFVYDHGRLRLLDGTPMAEQFSPSQLILKSDNTIVKEGN